MIKNISVCETHGCAVDSAGRLFCWGTGPNGELGIETKEKIVIPTIVTKQKQINVKQAVCSKNYTAFCSCKFVKFHDQGAGYVFIFGSLAGSQTDLKQSVDLAKSLRGS